MSCWDCCVACNPLQTSLLLLHQVPSLAWLCVVFHLTKVRLVVWHASLSGIGCDDGSQGKQGGWAGLWGSLATAQVRAALRTV